MDDFSSQIKTSLDLRICLFLYILAEREVPFSSQSAQLQVFSRSGNDSRTMFLKGVHNCAVFCFIKIYVNVNFVIEFLECLLSLYIKPRDAVGD